MGGERDGIVTLANVFLPTLALQNPPALHAWCNSQGDLNIPVLDGVCVAATCRALIGLSVEDLNPPHAFSRWHIQPYYKTADRAAYRRFVPGELLSKADGSLHFQNQPSPPLPRQSLSTLLDTLGESQDRRSLPPQENLENLPRRSLCRAFREKACLRTRAQAARSGGTNGVFSRHYRRTKSATRCRYSSPQKKAGEGGVATVSDASLLAPRYLDPPCPARQDPQRTTPAVSCFSLAGVRFPKAPAPASSWRNLPLLRQRDSPGGCR